MKAEVGREDQVGTAKTGRNSGDAATCAEADMATRLRTKAEVAATGLMEAVVERGNLKLAYQRVIENKGAAGVDQLAGLGIGGDQARPIGRAIGERHPLRVNVGPIRLNGRGRALGHPHPRLIDIAAGIGEPGHQAA
mgnify:CR=1 FL=1